MRKRARWGICLCMMLGMLLAAREVRSMEAETIPSLLACLRSVRHLDLCREPVPMDMPEVRESLERELLLTLWNRDQVLILLKRAPRYFPMIQAMLREAGMPEDLKYVVVAESAFRTRARSSKGAAGFWQFMPETGKNYGLSVTERTDERHHLENATKAALEYLRRLREMFPTWSLALAAYNMGENGLKAQIVEQGVEDYYRLYLPLETERYVFRILAIKVIFSNPEGFGFRLLPEDLYPPLETEIVTLECPSEIPLRIVAEAGKTYYKKLKELNPEILGSSLPKGTHTLRFPKGSANGIRARFQTLVQAYVPAPQRRERPAQSRESEEKVLYEVKKGDTLSSIARRFDVPMSSLSRWNRLDPGRAIRPGDRLIIHGKEQGR